MADLQCAGGRLRLPITRQRKTFFAWHGTLVASSLSFAPLVVGGAQPETSPEGVVDGSQNETECAGSLLVVWIRGRRRFRDVLKTRIDALPIDHEGLSVAPVSEKTEEPGGFLITEYID
ncbi:MAG TPA: hypothetical protein PKD49_00180 [Hyphomicrobium sp.]|nr:hypothetical protein [Hyphomicrobium sp.]